jgi:hypothetical protein
MPLGRRINQFLLFKKSAQYKDLPGDVQAIISGSQLGNPRKALCLMELFLNIRQTQRVRQGRRVASTKNLAHFGII